MANQNFEKLLEYIVNGEQEKAEELFHALVVNKSREIYEGLFEEEMKDVDMDESAEEEEDMEEASEEEPSTVRVQHLVPVDSSPWFPRRTARVVVATPHRPRGDRQARRCHGMLHEGRGA